MIKRCSKHTDIKHCYWSHFYVALKSCKSITPCCYRLRLLCKRRPYNTSQTSQSGRDCDPVRKQPINTHKEGYGLKITFILSNHHPIPRIDISTRLVSVALLQNCVCPFWLLFGVIACWWPFCHAITSTKCPRALGTLTRPWNVYPSNSAFFNYFLSNHCCSLATIMSYQRMNEKLFNDICC